MSWTFCESSLSLSSASLWYSLNNQPVCCIIMNTDELFQKLHPHTLVPQTWAHRTTLLGYWRFSGYQAWHHQHVELFPGDWGGPITKWVEENRKQEWRCKVQTSDFVLFILRDQKGPDPYLLSGLLSGNYIKSDFIMSHTHTHRGCSVCINKFIENVFYNKHTGSQTYQVLYSLRDFLYYMCF